jgi:hypothetical protein
MDPLEEQRKLRNEQVRKGLAPVKKKRKRKPAAKKKPTSKKK